MTVQLVREPPRDGTLWWLSTYGACAASRPFFSIVKMLPKYFFLNYVILVACKIHIRQNHARLVVFVSMKSKEVRLAVIIAVFQILCNSCFSFYFRRHDERSRDYQSCCFCCACYDIFPTFSFWEIFKSKKGLNTDLMNLVMSVFEP